MESYTFTPCEPPPKPELNEASKLARELFDTIGSEMQTIAERIALAERFVQVCHELPIGEEVLTPDGIWCYVDSYAGDDPLLTEDGYGLEHDGGWCTCSPEPKFTFFWSIVGKWSHGYACCYCRRVVQIG